MELSTAELKIPMLCFRCFRIPFYFHLKRILIFNTLFHVNQCAHYTFGLVTAETDCIYSFKAVCLGHAERARQWSGYAAAFHPKLVIVTLLLSAALAFVIGFQ